jgi:predicted Zn-dependent protease
MKRADLALIAPLLGIAAWIAIQANDIRSGGATSQSAAALGTPFRHEAEPQEQDRADAADQSSPATTFASTSPSAAVSDDRSLNDLPSTPARVSASAANGDTRANARRHEPAPLRNLMDIRRRLDAGESGTYINDVLTDRDSALARWPDRLANPLLVWVQSGDSVPDWNPAFVAQVRDAFTTWESTGVPVGFQFVNDSAAADVHVTWLDHFDEQISGKTMWARDENWWIVDANIVIALHHNHGEALDPSAIRAIALHEVGHLLGLDHTADTTNIMTPRVRVRDLSAADRATMKLLYSLPPGPVR